MLRAMQIRHAKFLTSAPDLAGCPPGILPEFAFIGRSNVGKSSLVNFLVGRGHKGLAKVSATPGKTQLLNFFEIDDRWMMVDLPGYGFAKVAEGKRRGFNQAVAEYLSLRPQLKCVLVLIDSRLPPQAIDREFLEWLLEIGAGFVLVFTKADKQSPAKSRAAVARYEEDLPHVMAACQAVFITSAAKATGRGDLLRWIGASLDQGGD